MVDRHDKSQKGILLRVPAADKARLDDLIARLNQSRPGANYTAQSILLAGLAAQMAALEKELQTGAKK